MEEFIAFLARHWTLTLAFIIVLLFLIMNELRERFTGVPKLLVAQLTVMMNHDSIQIIDLRKAADYQAGHILGSKNIPFEQLSDQLGTLAKNKEQAIVFVCAMGHQSPQAGKLLKQQGVENVHALAGGMNSWQHDNMPLVTQ